MSQHTPGPWTCKVRDDGAVGFIVGPDNVLVADAYPDTHQDLALPVSWRANARLIAAAPEMYQAVQDIIDLLPKLGLLPASNAPIARWYDMARALLAKVEGK